MKKFLAMTLALVMALSLVACGQKTETTTTTPADTSSASTEEPADAGFSVAMITDYGDITDQSFNQTTYEACKAYCDANGVQFNYYKPAGDSTAERVAMVEKAVDEGYTVVVMPGYAFGETITQVADEYPDITFIALDVGEGDLGDYTLPSNVYCAVYQ
jgi:basic membrane protein A